jgi:hypothetical protein
MCYIILKAVHILKAQMNKHKFSLPTPAYFRLIGLSHFIFVAKKVTVKGPNAQLTDIFCLVGVLRRLFVLNLSQNYF